MHDSTRYRRPPALVPLVAAAVLIVASGAARLYAADPPPKADPNDGQWAVVLEGFFPGETKKGSEPKRLNCYLVRRGGQWATALATATNNGRPNWNTALMPIDPSNAVFKDGKLTGTLALTLVPDPWVPKDQKPRQETVTLDVTVTPRVPAVGRWPWITAAFPEPTH